MSRCTQAHYVLELHVVVHHAVQDEQPVLQPFSEIDGRTAAVVPGCLPPAY